MLSANGKVYNGLELCVGGNSVFCMPVTEVQFINKISLFVPLLNVIRQAGTTADIDL
jgi:hypothetical protein